MLSIKEIQGTGLFSAWAGKYVETQGVVTGILRAGFYIQTPGVNWDGQSSDAVFVYGDNQKVQLGNLIRVGGECLNFLKHEAARPITQIKLQDLSVLETLGPKIEPVLLCAKLLPESDTEQAAILNSLEGMLVTIPALSTFIAPSNLFGDYVCVLAEQLKTQNILQEEHGGVVAGATNHQRWFPGFRVRDYRLAKKLNVGATLLTDIVGPLHYRAESWQVAADQAFAVNDQSILLKKSDLSPSNGAVTVMTLNCFNLDMQVESAALVKNPKQDIDNDWGDKRFHSLAHAVVTQGNLPDIIALQEIQDNDGAELGNCVDASKTYTALVHLIKLFGGVEYQWVDIAPLAGADGGQPGGNIRNGYLYNPARVALLEHSVQRIGEYEACFVDSRKALMATFREQASAKDLTVINVHLASKREQLSIFSPQNPGMDIRETIRIQQAAAIHKITEQLLASGNIYYITGDFNDHEHSQTLRVLVGKSNTNLVLTLAPELRYDYNHRGKLQVLMHGILPQQLVIENKVAYEIIHGNELIGVAPGEVTDKPSDHAYVIAKITLV